MTERELLEKIVKVIENTEFVTGYYPKNIVNIKQRTTYDSHSSLTNFVTTISFDFACVLADALLRSGIGDMSEYKHRAEVAERAGKIIQDNMARVYDMSNPRICKIVTSIWDLAKRQSEKELQEERKDE